MLKPEWAERSHPVVEKKEVEMTNTPDPIKIMVQTHPTGRRTLAISQSGSIFHQLDGELCGNDDPASFYRAVAAYMGKLSALGQCLLYTDADG